MDLVNDNNARLTPATSPKHRPSLSASSNMSRRGSGEVLRFSYMMCQPLVQKTVTQPSKRIPMVILDTKKERSTIKSVIQDAIEVLRRNVSYMRSYAFFKANNCIYFCA